jgi:hypothetical protein
MTSYGASASPNGTWDALLFLSFIEEEEGESVAASVQEYEIPFSVTSHVHATFFFFFFFDPNVGSIRLTTDMYKFASPRRELSPSRGCYRG